MIGRKKQYDKPLFHDDEVETIKQEESKPRESKFKDDFYEEISIPALIKYYKRNQQ